MSRLILNIETSEKNCSVALGENGEVAAELHVASEGFVHGEQLHVLIAQLMEVSKVSFAQLSAIAVSEGPGSYTGLRIGVSAAKGLAYSCQIPLIAIPTLQAMNAGLREEDKVKFDYLIPMIDARRMEVYACVFDRENKLIAEVSPEELYEESFNAFRGCIGVFGSGAKKSLAVLPDTFELINEEMNFAQNMVVLSDEKYQKSLFEDVAYFEPVYLKEFKTGVPKKLWN